MAQAQVVENLFNFYLTWWTKQEINTLVNQGNLVILPLENQGLQIAHYQISPARNRWLVKNLRSEKSYLFTEKLSAVFYCLYEHKRRYNQSAELLYQDDLLGKLENDEHIYRHKYIMARKKQDHFAQDLWQARLSETVPRLNFAKDQLQKMIKQAKYIKIWD